MWRTVGGETPALASCIVMGCDWSGAVDAALLAAAAGNDAAGVAAALGNGGDPDARLSDGTPALVLAARHPRGEAAMELLAADVDVNAADVVGLTAVHVAAQVGGLPLAAALVRAGADLSLRCRGGLTAAQHAALHGHHVVAFTLHPGSADGTMPPPPRRSGREAVPERVGGAKVRLPLQEPLGSRAAVHRAPEAPRQEGRRQTAVAAGGVAGPLRLSALQAPFPAGEWAADAARQRSIGRGPPAGHGRPTFLQVIEYALPVDPHGRAATPSPSPLAHDRGGSAGGDPWRG